MPRRISVWLFSLTFLGFIHPVECNLFAQATDRDETSVATAPIPMSEQEVNEHRRCARFIIRKAEYTLQDMIRSIELAVTVDASGSVMSAIPQKGQSQYFAEASTLALSCHYEPFIRDGKAVTTTFTETVGFRKATKESGLQVPFPTIKDLGSIQITLERSGCLGSCPAYSVEVRGTGEIAYTGKSSVVVAGQHHAKISQAAVGSLVEVFRAANYYATEDNYVASATDSPSYSTSISIDGRKKSVEDYIGEYEGMPPAITEVEDAIDRFAGTERWIKGNAETVSDLKAEGWRFRSVESGKMLALAAGAGSDDFVRDLLAEGAPIRVKSAKDAMCSGECTFTPLVQAARRGDLAMVDLLLSYGAGKGDQTSMDEALAGAGRSGGVELLRLLLSNGANPNVKLADGSNTLMAVAASGLPANVAEILQYNPEVNARDREGKTAIFFASDGEDVDDERHADRTAVIRLLASAGANLNAKDKDGNTALHETIDGAAAQALVDNGANVNLRNKDGQTPLISTVADDVAAVLIKAGADLYIRDNGGKTAIERDRERNYTAKAALIEAAMKANLVPER